MFVCNGCQADALTIGKTLEVMPEDDSDEQSVQVVTCGSCAAEFVAVYEESRRGSLDSESWHHDAWSVPVDKVREVAAAIDACPSPRSRQCKCATHLAYNEGGFRKHLSGTWFRMRSA